MIRPKMVRGTSRGDDIGKIFVGGLSADTSKDSLQEYFGSFGEVTDCIVMRDNSTKRSRGFGFVTFQDPTSVDKVCQKSEHILDNKKIDPKRAVPRGPGQQAAISQQSPAGPTVRDSGKNENKIFVGGLGSNTTENDLHGFFSSFGIKYHSNVEHVKLMYDKETNRMRGFGFVTFDSSEAVEEAVRIRHHDINGKMVEVKKAEQQQPKGSAMGMNVQMNAGYGRGQYGHPQQPGMMGAAAGMGRGYSGYSMASGYQPMASTGYGYSMGQPAFPAYGVDHSSMYGTQAGQAMTAAFGTGYGTAPTSAAASMPATSAVYGDYSQMPVASQPGMPGAAPGAQPRLDSAATPDYTVYGLGNYQQQESSYGPARTSQSSDSGGYPGYTGADQTGYAGYGADSFGRGANVSRGYHPYGR